MEKKLNKNIKLLKDNAFFINPVNIGFEEITQKTQDITEQLHSSSYLKFCFNSNVTKIIGRETFDSILELSSGNNDLGFFSYFIDEIKSDAEKTDYNLSNYSGGRGDYFTINKMLLIENKLYERLTKKKNKYSVNNITLTFSGQGAYSAIASYLKSSIHSKKNILFFDSTYCSNYKPFSRKDLNLKFIKTDKNKFLPKVSELLKAINKNSSMLFLVKFHNPSGQFYSRNELEQIIKKLKECNVYLVYSEAYDYLSWDTKYDNHVISISEELNYDKLIRVKTLSKDRGLAGLRAGYMIGPEEIVKHTIKFNDEIAYNPPMINNPIFIIHLYITYFNATGKYISDLNNEISNAKIRKISNKTKKNEIKQINYVKNNFQFILKELFNKKMDKKLYGEYIENQKYGLVIPSGGINCILRIKYLESFDEIDIFRKLYINTGLIMHSSKFILKKKDGYWIRITLSHKFQKIKKIISVLKELELNLSKSNNDYEFLNKNTIKVKIGGKYE
ncbi:MAG: pyridoxal phosphate-dependent aminotransferase [Candidatus Woesearchaeota archaeon]